MDGMGYDLIVKKHNQQTGRQLCRDFGSEMCYFWNFQKGAEQWFFAADDPTDATGCSMGELNTIYIYTIYVHIQRYEGYNFTALMNENSEMVDFFLNDHKGSGW